MSYSFEEKQAYIQGVVRFYKNRGYTLDLFHKSKNDLLFG